MRAPLRRDSFPHRVPAPAAGAPPRGAVGDDDARPARFARAGAVDAASSPTRRSCRSPTISGGRFRARTGAPPSITGCRRACCRSEPRRSDYVAFVGRISPEKRVDRAIEIARRAGMELRIAAKIDAADREYFEREIAPLMDQPARALSRRDRRRGEGGAARRRARAALSDRLARAVRHGRDRGAVVRHAGAGVARRLGAGAPRARRHRLDRRDSIDAAVEALRQVDAIDRSARAAPPSRSGSRPSAWRATTWPSTSACRRRREAASRRAPHEGRRPMHPMPITSSPRPGSIPRHGRSRTARPSASSTSSATSAVGAGQGLYHDGTRHLSLCQLRLTGHRPFLLGSSTGTGGHVLTVHLTNPDLPGDHELLWPKAVMHVRRVVVPLGPHVVQPHQHRQPRPDAAVGLGGSVVRRRLPRRVRGARRAPAQRAAACCRPRDRRRPALRVPRARRRDAAHGGADRAGADRRHGRSAAWS